LERRGKNNRGYEKETKYKITKIQTNENRTIARMQLQGYPELLLIQLFSFVQAPQNITMPVFMNITKNSCHKGG
jgi:hypothetical protein